MIEAIRLTVDNLEEVEKFCKGKLKGTLLPPEQQVIEFYNYLGVEDELEVGEYLVKTEIGFIKFRDNSFSKSFDRINWRVL